MKKPDKIISVTKTYLPPLKEYVKYLEKIWETGWVTNHGPFVAKLEKKLKDYLGVKNLFFISNGTTALQIAIKALEIKGDEVITTPFSYIATTSSLIWEGCKPVFVDINPQTLCIDADKIEKAVSKTTKAIMAVHVYGNPCDVKKIEKIAKKFNLKIIYDAAHAFGVKYGGQSILRFGDLSVLSFHATKIFHTIEGGAIITQNDELAHKISYMMNFGHNGLEDFFGLGINGKNSELHAAMGLNLLSKVKQIIERRKTISEIYNKILDHDKIKKLKTNKKATLNYGYYPIILESERQLFLIKSNLNKYKVMPRRYFYPSLNSIDHIKKHIKNTSCPISEDISKRILCLPLYYDLQKKDVMRIGKIILDSLT